MGQKVLLIYKSVSISFGGIFINLYCQWQYFSIASMTQFYKPYVFWPCRYKKKKYTVVFNSFASLLNWGWTWCHILKGTYIFISLNCLFVPLVRSLFNQFVNLFLTCFWNPLILWDINCKYVFLSLSFAFGLRLCCSAIHIIFLCCWIFPLKIIAIKIFQPLRGYKRGFHLFLLYFYDLILLFAYKDVKKLGIHCDIWYKEE